MRLLFHWWDQSDQGQAPPRFSPSGHERPRIVVENVGRAERFVEKSLLEEAGYDVVTCGGPRELTGERCPLPSGGSCPAVADADVLISSFRAQDPQGTEILGAIRRRYPDTPLIVEAPPAAVDSLGEVLEGCHVLYPLTGQRLLDAIDTVFEHRATM